LLLLVSSVRGAAPPGRLTPQQVELLRQANRSFGQANADFHAKQIDGFIANGLRGLTLERRVHGEVPPRRHDWLRGLARRLEQGRRWDEAGALRAEVLAGLVRLHGQGDWRVREARLDLEQTRRLAGMTDQQRDLLRQAQRWNDEVVRLWQQGKAKEALPLAQKALALRQQLLGRAHPQTALSWLNLGAQHAALHNLREAEHCYRTACALYRQALGERHPEYAGSLNNLASLYQDLGEPAKALRLYLEARDLCKQTLGVRHPYSAQSLNNLASLYLDLGEHSKALPLFLAARELTKQTLGVRHPDYAQSLNNLASLYQGMGEHSKALPLLLEASAIRKQALGDRHPDYALSLNNLAALYQEMGEHSKALPLFLEARDIRKKVLGARHPDYALSLSTLAALYQDIGEYDKALPLYLEASAIRKQALGARHPHYADSLNNLGMLYRDMGEPGKALPLLLQARAVRKKALGERHPHYASSLSHLAALYKDMGEPGKALSLYLEARDIRKQTLGERHPRSVASLNNLAALYRDMGEPGKALPLLLEVRDLTEKTLGQRHPSYALSLNNLALLYKDLGEPAKALRLYLEARDLCKQTLGVRHPHYAISLNNLAALYRDMRDPGKALPLFLEARDITRKVLGERHPHYAGSLNNLALLYQGMGKPRGAVEQSQQALGVLEGYLDDNFDLLGERHRLQITQNALHNLGFLLSCQEQAGQPSAERYRAVLSWKGRVAARGALDRLAADHPQLRGDLEALRAARARLGRLTLRTPDPAGQAAWLKQVQALTEQKERLEAELSRRSAAFRRLGRRLTPGQLSQLLPADLALVDLLEYTHYTLPKGGKGKLQQEQRLLAFVLRRGKEPVLVRLGPMTPIAEAVRAWRQPVTGEQQRGTVKDAVPFRPRAASGAKQAALLRQWVWEPLSRHLGGAKVVLMAPDGALCQLPLGALPGSKPGTFLMEEVAIAQLASARQLVDLLDPAGKAARPGRGLLALGGVDYGPGKTYRPLPGTAPEARRCAALFRAAFAEPVRLLQGSEATPAALRVGLGERPRFLHLATHGYFEPADRVQRLLKGLAGREGGSGLLREQVLTLTSLPGLRCGLALAGANRAPPPDDLEALPNVLTGQDLEGLDLRDCELAVLSACQTAIGDIARSQGVLGLQRAFHAAGARTTVCSLWSVNDAATSVLMEEFYQRLWGKRQVSKLEALRQAQLFVLANPDAVLERARELRADLVKRGVGEQDLETRGLGIQALTLPKGGKGKRRSPVAWWAAFVLSGDWR
jgi:CHAT domain-containing protein